MCEREGVGITVIVYNPCVKGRNWYHGYFKQPACGREGLSTMIIIYNPCVEGKELVSWLLYTTRV